MSLHFINNPAFGIWHDDETDHPGMRISGSCENELETEMMKQELRKAIDFVFSTLTPKEELVLRLRFGLDGTEEERSVSGVARLLGVRRQSVHQKIERAINKLKHPSRCRRLIFAMPPGYPGDQFLRFASLGEK